MKACLGRWCVLAALASCANATLASTVTVDVRSSSGAPVTDTVLAFDPLGVTPMRSHEAAIVDQVNKRFVPHVSVVRTGTSVTFPNSDHIRHQVYSFSAAKTFSLKLYAGSPKVDVLFDKPGLVILGCNIHDTMVAFVAVVDTPYFGKVTDSGSVALELPAGRYKLRVWHPDLAAAIAQEIEVGAAPLTIPLTIELDPNREAVAAWPE
jgi:plastocyanin